MNCEDCGHFYECDNTGYYDVCNERRTSTKLEIISFKRINAAYLGELKAWAHRLEADEMTIHQDGTISLACKDGGICNHYKPTPAELKGERG